MDNAERLREATLIKLKETEDVVIQRLDYSVITHENTVAFSSVPEGVQHPSMLNDPRMGCNDKVNICGTCNQSSAFCSGHPAHINLTLGGIASDTLTNQMYVFVPTQMKLIADLISVFCMNGNCKSPYRTIIFSNRHFIGEKTLNPYQDLKPLLKHLVTNTNSVSTGKRTCDVCKQKIEYELTPPYKFTMKGSGASVPLDPAKVFLIFDKVSTEEMRMLGLKSHPRNLIMRSIFVIAPQYRPKIQLEKTTKDDSFTLTYIEIIKFLIDKKKSKQDFPILQNIIASLYVKSGKDKNVQTIDLPTFINGRDGMVRNEMLGKRVNFSGRTVIGPGPNLKFGEIGFPRKMAEVLTVPEVVTMDNLNYLESLLQSDKIKFYIDRFGSRREITPQVLFGKVLEIGETVERCLQNGDWVVINRQPSLHKFSEMSGRIIIHEENIIRIPLPYCKSFNADFDGDEMNVHVPQSKEAIAEVELLMNVRRNIINDQTSKPAYGQVLDTVLGCWLMTKDENVPFDVVMNCNMALSEPWFLGHKETGKSFLDRLQKYNVSFTSGRAIFSLVLPEDFSFATKAKEIDDLGNEISVNVMIKDGVLISGAVGGKMLGYSNATLQQEIMRKYGTEIAADFISNTTQVVDKYNEYRGFTVGFGDIPSEDSKPINLIRKLEIVLNDVAAQNFTTLTKYIEEFKSAATKNYTQNLLDIQHDLKTDKKMTKAQIVDKLKGVTGLGGERETFMTLRQYKKGQFDIIRDKIAGLGPVIREGLEAAEYEKKASGILNSVSGGIARYQAHYLTPDNSLMAMSRSGAKGDEKNINAMIGSLGQQNFKGRQLSATMFGNRATPVDLPDDPDPEVRGYVKRSYLQGLTPKELNSHITASREGLIDTGIGLSDTGYTQRRMFTSFVDIRMNNKGAVVNANRKILQFVYGEDGLNATSIRDVKVGDMELSQPVDIGKVFDEINNDL